MKVSLSSDDVAELDRYVAERGLSSRSEGICHAIRLLRVPMLAAEYAVAFQEWDGSEDKHLWEQVVADGFTG